MDATLTLHDQRVARVLDLELVIARAQAEQLTLLAELAAEPLEAGEDPAEYWTAEELSGPLHITPGSAAYRLRAASGMGRFPRTLGLLSVGLVTLRHLHLLDEHTRSLSDDLATAVEDRVLARASRLTPPAYRREVRRAILALDPAGSGKVQARAQADRRVIISPAENGMSSLWALLPAPDAAAIQAAITALADQTSSQDGRSSDQRRADALTQLALDRLNGVTGDPLPTQQGRRPHIQVTVALSTLAGLDDAPAELDGEPIPAQLARQLAADPTGTWQRLITDDTGHLLHVDPKRYKPPQPIVDHVVTRDRRCRFPGCERRATRTDLDHLIPYRRGGKTLPSNLHCLCRRHHRLKHDPRWKITGDPDGTITWTDPHGRRHSDPPDQPGPDRWVPPET